MVDRKVVDRLGNEVNVGYIITFIEQQNDYGRRWKKAYFGRAVVTKICEKTILIEPLLIISG